MSLDAGEWKRQEHILGNGTQGQVCLWINTKTGGKIAIKSFFSNNAGIQKEIKIMKSCNRRYIVKTLECPQEIISGIPPSTTADYLISFVKTSPPPILGMEFCSGGTLRQMLQRPENLNGLQEADVRIVLNHLSKAIQYLHAREIIHRDIKPENVLIHNDFQAGKTTYKLGDLGLAKDISINGSLGKTYCGSKSYLAPEICDIVSGHLLSGNAEQKDKKYGKSVDYWSFGIITFEISCGIIPFLPYEQDYYRYKAVKEKPNAAIAVTMDEKNVMKYHDQFPFKTRLSNEFQTQLTGWLRSMLQFNKNTRGKIKTQNGEEDGFICLQKILKAKYLTIQAQEKPLHFLLSEQCTKVKDVLRLVKSRHQIEDDNPWLFTFEGILLASENDVVDVLKEPVYLLKRSGTETKTEELVSKILHSTFVAFKASPDDPLEIPGTLLWRVAIHDVQKLLEKTITLYNYSVALRKLYMKISQKPQLDLACRLFALNILIEQEDECHISCVSSLDSSIVNIKKARDSVIKDMTKSGNDDFYLDLDIVNLGTLENAYQQMLNEHPKWKESKQNPASLYDLKDVVKIIWEFFTVQKRIMKKITANIEKILQKLNIPQDDYNARKQRSQLQELDKLIKLVQARQAARNSMLSELCS